MTIGKFEKFKKALEEKKQSLEGSLSDTANKDSHPAGNWESKFPKFDEDSSLEEASDEVEEFLTRLPLEQSHEVQLKAVNEALGRIKKGTYGKCSNCKEKIPLKRLEIMPETTICLKCKKKKK